MTREREVGGGSVAADDDDATPDGWTAAERALLDAALGFYDAADGVIDYGGQERPQLRRDTAGFAAIRRAMATLEQRVHDAHAAGVTPERIAQIARIEREMVVLILERPAAALSSEAS